MTKGRKTTLQERMDIVLYCLNHHRNFSETAERFQVTYQQAYGWGRKYEAGGQEVLRDGRGRTKTSEELTEADQQKLAMKKLESGTDRGHDVFV
jgi:transposase-like protein